MTTDKDRGAFPSAREDEKSARLMKDTPQTRSASYSLAFADTDFLLRDELRPVRLQLELLKPELALQEEGIDSTIVVFGSARTPSPDDSSGEGAGDYHNAREFARLMSVAETSDGKRNIIVTGGGPGIMEAANRGAHEAGARNVGLNIVLPHEQAPNPYITPDLSFQFHYFAIRKMHFLMRARALVCFPGGFGTMDELFETLTLIQTGKIVPIPVLLFREDWWRRIVNFEALAEDGKIGRDDLDIFRFVETAEAAAAMIAEFYGEAG